MIYAQKEFLRIIGCSLNKNSDEKIEYSDAMEILTLAKIHNVLPLVYDYMRKNGYAEDFAFKNSAIRQATLQAMRTQKFLYVYGELLRSGVSCLCVKGLILRNIYPEPDFRPSSDEDLFIKKSDFETLKAILEKNGFKTERMENDELSFIDRKSGLIIEASSLPFPGEGKLNKKMNNLFNNIFDNHVEMNISENKILTLAYTDHLLYLLLHAFKHFIMGGVGIRQVCDILLFSEKYSEKIDFRFVFESLKKINAYEFALGIFEIGFSDLGFKKEKILFAIPTPKEKTENLLSDIVSAGIYGKSSSERLHSSSVTLNAVEENGNRSKAILKTAFPNKSALSKRYPILKRYSILLPIIWIIRFFGYISELSKADSDKGSIETADKRLKLMREYHIIQSKEKRRTTTVDENKFKKAMLERFENDQKIMLNVTGDSMSPFLINQRDSVLLKKPTEKFHKGDIALYKRENEKLVLHRIVKINNEGIFMKGDAQQDIEGPIKKENILAFCVVAIRKEKVIKNRSLIWRVFEIKGLLNRD